MQGKQLYHSFSDLNFKIRNALEISRNVLYIIYFIIDPHRNSCYCFVFDVVVVYLQMSIIEI